MSRRIQRFTPLRQDKNGTTYHRDTVARERMSRDDRAKASHLKWDYDLTLKAITTGQYKPMNREKAERIARRLMT